MIKLSMSCRCETLEEIESFFFFPNTERNQKLIKLGWVNKKRKEVGENIDFFNAVMGEEIIQNGERHFIANNPTKRLAQFNRLCDDIRNFGELTEEDKLTIMEAFNVRFNF